MIKSNCGKLINYLLILTLGVSLCGCTLFLIGGAVGALGGYAITKDTIQGETDKDYNAIWNSAKKVLSMMEAVEIDLSAKGKIEAKIGKSKVFITAEQLTPDTTRLKIKCRKFLLPNLGLAQKLYVRILEHAK